MGRFDVDTKFPDSMDYHSDAFVQGISAILPPKRDPGHIGDNAEEVYFEDADPSMFGRSESSPLFLPYPHAHPFPKRIHFASAPHRAGSHTPRHMPSTIPVNRLEPACL